LIDLELVLGLLLATNRNPYRVLVGCLIVGLVLVESTETPNFSFGFVSFTVRLHVVQRTVLLSQFCLSVSLSDRPFVCPSVRRVYCDKTE